MLKTVVQRSDLGNHRQWRRHVKKLRRKRVRQKLAQKRDLRIEEDNRKLLQTPQYQVWLQEQEALEKFQQEVEEREREENEEKWMRRELIDQKRFRELKKRREAIEAVKENERLRIQKEFEEQQKLVQQRIEEKKRIAKEKRRAHELLVEKIQEYVNGLGEFPDELRVSADTNPNKELCPFFIKTASCRFGDKCSRNHSRPGISSILLLPHFFSNIRLEQPLSSEYGSDLALEFSESELYREYDSFFEDVTAELVKLGKLNNFQTCQNYEAHLRGNVYVEFTEERDAVRAYQQLQGRYYAGKRINVEFCKLASWKAAICGLSLSRKCPKGRNCNFLHVFKNPGNRFNSKDPIGERSEQRYQPPTSTNPSSSWNDDDTSCRRNWRWSESPEHDIRRNEHNSERRHNCDRSSQRSSSRSRRSTERSTRRRKSRSSSRCESTDRKKEQKFRPKSPEKKKRRRHKRTRTKSKERSMRKRR